MIKVPFFDARRILGMPHHGGSIGAAYERAAARVIRSGRYILGPEVEAFEHEAAAYLGAPYAVACSSGTDALVLALRCLNMGPGCTVAVPAFTFIATAEAVVRVGAAPVFVDVDERGLMFDLEPANESIGVDLFGASALGRDGITDQAQAFGRDAARDIAISTHSFYPTKNLPGLGDGGLVATSSPTLAEHLRSLRNHGQAARGIHGEIGGNHRLDEIQAACLRVGLQHVDEWLAMRAATAARYIEAFAGLPVTLPHRHPGETWNQYVIQTPRRDALCAHLTAQGIGCDVYYPIALPHQPCFAYLGHRMGDFPVAERLARESLALPIFPGITEEEIDAVIASVKAFFE